MNAEKLFALIALWVVIQTIGLLAIAYWLAPPSEAAGPSAAWKLTLNPLPANIVPGGSTEYILVATNVGAGATNGEPVNLKLTLPPGLTGTAVSAANNDRSASEEPKCGKPEGPIVTCTTTSAIHPGRLLAATITASASASEGTLEAEGSVEGGGAASVTTKASAPVSTSAVPFDFLPGFEAPSNGEDGLATAAAGTHPYQLTVDLNFPTQRLGGEITGAGHPRDIVVNLPRGVAGSLGAVPVLCTEAELSSQDAPGCPEASQVGVVNLTSGLGPVGTTFVETNSLYAMVPPPGSPAMFGFDAIGIGYFVHATAGIRSDGDYGLYSTVNDTLAFGSHPIYNFQAQIWGSPTDSAHDLIRGNCEEDGERGIPGEPCSVEGKETAFLTEPGDCPGNPPLFTALSNSWEEPETQHETSYENADLLGNPTPIEGCGALQFTPTIEARPTTNLTDSPAGLDFTLHQPQDMDFEGASTANLKDTTITFPVGLAVNPAQATGLGACSLAQIGYQPKEGQIHFSKAPQGCSDAAKIGTAEATTPALVQHDEEHKTIYDPEGNPVPEPLHGALYIAEPFKNPFGSLIATYLVIEDPKSGLVAKLAGKGELDPVTGQISARFEEAPEQPIEDFKVHIFGGARGAFITPPTCATHTTTADLTPWSAPDGKDQHPSDSFQTVATPGGGPCPTSESQLPNKPTFSAGTLSPAAGKYSPLIFKLSREDGSQRLAGIDATLPTGLSARLAGLATCSEAQIAKAKAREAPNQGAAEQADPSCPASSEVGIVNVGAGAGPTPYYTQAHAYLAAPYKGAPLSLVFIAPAVAGPFDLGAVVVRAAIYLDPTTAQARVVSDPLPQILDGIPLDVRSVAVKAARPQFTLNPTSCDEKSFGGSASSTLGQLAPLFQRFQVGGCKALPYKPKLHLRLFGPIHRGGHPRLRAVFEAKPGEANTARILVALPQSEFIDQAHFRTICTRVQFAADQCPAGSVYGHVKAITPLLDYPLEGPVYLRSSSHQLPDVVAALRGPPSQPIEADVVGRVDSVNGGLRTRIETAPDVPVRKVIFTLQGAKKGLFQNSTNICKGTFRATVNLDGQNGKAHDTRPPIKADCPKATKHKRGGHHR